MKRLTEFLNNNTYPGRGIVLGTSPDGTKQVIIYFIMGRSTNSRKYAPARIAAMLTSIMGRLCFTMLL